MDRETTTTKDKTMTKTILNITDPKNILEDNARLRSYIKELEDINASLMGEVEVLEGEIRVLNDELYGDE